MTVPAAQVRLTRDWPAPDDIPADFGFGLDPNAAGPIYPEGQTAFRGALAADLESSLRPDPGATGRSAELVLTIARVRGDWDGTYPDDEPRTEREDLANVLGQLASQSSAAIKERIRSIPASP